MLLRNRHIRVKSVGGRIHEKCKAEKECARRVFIEGYVYHSNDVIEYAKSIS